MTKIMVFFTIIRAPATNKHRQIVGFFRKVAYFWQLEKFITALLVQKKTLGRKEDPNRPATRTTKRVLSLSARYHLITVQLSECRRAIIRIISGVLGHNRVKIMRQIK